jgi:ABC-type phosphate transport system permease subunit
MVANEIIAAAVLGTITRILFMDGFDFRPVYQNGELHLNVLGTVVTAIIGTIALVMASPDVFATPLGAFVAAFGTAYTVDRVVTKLPLPQDMPPESS